jgi:hypothetical protein
MKFQLTFKRRTLVFIKKNLEKYGVIFLCLCLFLTMQTLSATIAKPIGTVKNLIWLTSIGQYKSIVEEVPVSTKSVNGSTQFLDELAKDTWNYLSSDWATDNHLPWSWRSKTIAGGDFVNTAEIGFYAVSWLGAYELDQPWSPAWSEVETEVMAILDRLRAWQTGSQTFQPHGPNTYNNSVFYQWYWVSWQEPVVGSGTGDHVVPSIDNAWLAASLITIREYAEINDHIEIVQQANAILDDMNFMLWYNASNHRFYWGDTEDPQGGSEIDYYSNENRIINFVAYALGQMSLEEFKYSLDALVQEPDTYANITVEKVAWDGSYFTYAGPALFIREMDTTYGERTLVPATEAQIAYAEVEEYSVWGLSDCFDVNADGYVQQGAMPVAGPSWPETRFGLVSPHASALALITPLSSMAISNLQTISNTWPTVYDPNYGFRDSVMTKQDAPDYGDTSERFSALNQEWIFLSLLNSQIDFVWTYFYRDDGVVTAHASMYGQDIYLPYIQSANNN